MKPKFKLCAALCAASLSTLAFAQSAARPDPTAAGRPAPTVEYQSVFSGYQPFREQKGNAWKEVNKEVADNPGMGPMGAMKDPSGKSIAGMEDKSGKGDMAGHGAMAGDGATQSKPTAPAGKSVEDCKASKNRAHVSTMAICFRKPPLWADRSTFVN